MTLFLKALSDSHWDAHLKQIRKVDFRNQKLEIGQIENKYWMNNKLAKNSSYLLENTNAHS